MALTNIFREPRREITETVVGVGIAAVALAGPYYFARWLEATTKDAPGMPVPWPIGALLGVLLEAVLIIGFVLIHSVGEMACDRLQASGIQLRPRKRL